MHPSVDIDFRGAIRVRRGEPNFYAIRTKHLLTAIHEFGPRYIAEIRRDFGNPIVDRGLRKDQIQRVRIEGGDIILLAKEGREQLGLAPYPKMPSPPSLHQRVLTAGVIRYLHHREDLRFEARHYPHITMMRDPDRRLVVVLTKRTNYRLANLRRLLSESLHKHLRQEKRMKILLFAHPTRHMERFETQTLYPVEVRDIRPYLDH